MWYEEIPFSKITKTSHPGGNVFVTDKLFILTEKSIEYMLRRNIPQILLRYPPWGGYLRDFRRGISS
jgi:hypothetical protein